MTTRVHDESNGRWVPALLIAGFGTLLLAQVALVCLALRSDPGVSTAGAYERGLAHNAVLRAAAAEAALGWRVEIENRGDAPHRGELVVVATDPAGRRLADLAVTGLVVRPTRPGLDRPLRFDPIGNGRYRASYDLPFPGLWELDLLLTRDGDTSQHAARFTVP